MKYLILLLIPLSINAKTIKEGDTEYQCNPVKTCDQKLKTAYAEIARLKKQVKVVYVDRTVEKIVEKTVIKKHIVSLSAVDSITLVEAKSNGNTGLALAESSYSPLLTYQYQTDSGITPLVGLSFGNKLKPVFGLGYKF
jgi:hypothetical protein